MGNELNSTAKARQRMRRNANDLESRDSWGEVGAAMVGDPAERAAAVARATVRLEVCHRIMCGCGNVLDTRSAAVVETASGDTIGVACKVCVPKWQELLPQSAAKIAPKVGPGVLVARVLHGSGKVVEVYTPQGE